MLENNQIMTDGTTRAADAMEESMNRALKSMTIQMREWSVQAFSILNGVATFYNSIFGGESYADSIQAAGAAYAGILDPPEDPKKAGRRNGIPDDAEGGATRAPRPKAADSIAKIGGILGGQTRSAKDQAAMESLRNQATMVASLDEIQKNTAPIREG